MVLTKVEISKLKNLEKPATPLKRLELYFIKISSTAPSQLQTWFEVEVSQLKSATPVVT